MNARRHWRHVAFAIKIALSPLKIDEQVNAASYILFIIVKYASAEERRHR